MLTAHLAARALGRQRAEAEADFARQLPLYAEGPIPYHTAPDGGADTGSAEPHWSTDY